MAADIPFIALGTKRHKNISCNEKYGCKAERYGNRYEEK